MPRSKIVVKIHGSEYTLCGDESEDYLFSLANFLDKRIKETYNGNSRHSNTSAAVLTALTIADEYFKLKSEYDMYKKTSEEPEEKYKSVQNEYNELLEASNALHEDYEKVVEGASQMNEELEQLKADYEELYNKYVELMDEDERQKSELKGAVSEKEELESKYTELAANLESMKGQMLENEIELVRVNKELKDMKEHAYKRR